MFSCEFWEISKKTFFTEHLWTSASELYWFLNPMSNKLLKVDDKSTKVLPYENTRAIVENVYQSWIWRHQNDVIDILFHTLLYFHCRL